MNELKKHLDESEQAIACIEEAMRLADEADSLAKQGCLDEAEALFDRADVLLSCPF